MSPVYIDPPYNFHEIAPFVITDTREAAVRILAKKKCYFYDTCSFRRHANLGKEEIKFLLTYVKKQEGIVVITRCVLMELASHSGCLNQEYIQYIKEIYQFGIGLLVIYEENIFSVMEVCFSTNTVINGYLTWAVRLLRNPVSTITETLNHDKNLKEEIIKRKNAENQGIYKRFFTAVRNRKESGDNLGEELLAICLHILSYIPGEKDGKFCIITDDKGAAGKIDALFRQTRQQFQGSRIAIFSTPKLVQILYREKILMEKESIKEILSTGTNGNIAVLGTQIYDLRSREITLSCEELADLIMEPNGIQIMF